MPSFLPSRRFGVLPTGEPVDAWTLRGAGGLEVEAIPWGGIVTRLWVPDRNGAVADVVLGFAELEPYLENPFYFGAMVGRVAGRVSAAEFQLDGRRYRLAANDPPNHLHGGPLGFSKQMWTATPVARLDGAPSLCLSHRSPDGQEGYPGNVDVSVTYTVTDDNTFWIESEAVTDRATPFSLTHHSYFNLGGEASGTIEDHTLQIAAEEFVPFDEQMTLSGRVEPVAEGENDFRCARRLGEAIPRLFNHHGALYRLRTGVEQGAAPALAARLAHASSGRVLEVRTTEPFLQTYTAAALDGSVMGKSGVAYRQYAGLCLECQHYADGANATSVGDNVLRPGRARREVTAYAFSCAPVP